MWALGAFCVLAVVVSVTLFKLQIVHGAEYSEAVARQVTSVSTVSPTRGTIYDRNGEILATNKEITSVCISAKYVRYVIDTEKKTEDELREKNDRKYDAALARVREARAIWHDWLTEKARIEQQMESMSKADREAAENEIAEREKKLRQPVGSWTFDDGRTVEVWRDSETQLVVRDMPVDEMLARALHEICGADYDTILNRYSETYKDSEWYRVVKEADETTIGRIRSLREKLNLKYQVFFDYEYKRVYPNDTVACHVIGFLDGSGNGVMGLEKYYDDILSGATGKTTAAKDSARRKMPFAYESVIPVENGKNVVTTIDLTIQMELEAQLEKTYYESKAGNRVTGVALDPRTGEVLAMATYPPFNLNDPYTMDADQLAELERYERDELAQAARDLIEARTEAGKDVPSFEAASQQLLAAKRSEILWLRWNNKSISETYEPGSTFKAITTAMALEEKLVSLNEEFVCWGSYTVEGWPQPIKCHKEGGHGKMPFYQMLQQSCNPTLMQVAGRIGASRFLNYFSSFGYDVRTGIDLPYEEYPIVHDRSSFGNVDLAVSSFGQSFKVTPIRQLTAISAIANGGYLMTPHLMKTITDSAGNVVQSYNAEAVRQVVSTETCNTISWILEDGVSGNGGAKNAYVRGYKVAAKTGTSEKIDKDKETLRVGSCVAYAPYDNPLISVLILCDEPMGDSVYGSVVAAPYISNFLKSVLPYLGIESEYVEMQVVTVRAFEGATREAADADLNWRGIDYEIRGNGDTVTVQIPAVGTQIYKDTGKIILYTGTELPKYNITMPNVTGMTLGAAERILTNLGLNVIVSGSTGTDSTPVKSQSIEAGTKITEATSVEITGQYIEVSD